MVYIFPTELEAAPFRRICPDAEIHISGVGMAATAATLARLATKCREACYVLAGIAGGYGDAVALCDVVEVVCERCAELPERFVKEYRVVPRTRLRAVRSNTVCRPMERASGAEVENMEGAAFFAMAEALGLSVIEIRAVSNHVGESFDRWSVDEALEALAQKLLVLKYGE